MGHGRKRSSVRSCGPSSGSVRAKPVAHTVEDDHFAIEVVEGAQTKVAVAQDICDGDVAVVDTFE